MCWLACSGQLSSMGRPSITPRETKSSRLRKSLVCSHLPSLASLALSGHHLLLHGEDCGAGKQSAAFLLTRAEP